MTNDKGILIKNIYYMLAYSFHTLNQSNYEMIQTENFENVHDMFSAILGKGIASQLKRGLYREYVIKSEDLSVFRGKLDIYGTIKNRVNHNTRLACEYDELSENNILNQILKTTMQVLIKNSTVKPKYKAIIKKNLVFFDNVDSIDINKIRWNNITYQKGNESYKMLMNVCYLILTGLILSTEKGNIKMATFIDERAMHSIYEKFILEYYRCHHPEYNANPDKIQWNTDDGTIQFLPNMITDITLKYKNKTLIIDAKYYEHTFQTNYNTNTIHSDNLYQIFAYVKNLDKDNTGNVAGILLYAKTQEQLTPDNKYLMSGNTIWVKTLDLNHPFSQITQQLENIARSYFEV